MFGTWEIGRAMGANTCRNCGSTSRYVVTAEGVMRCLNCRHVVDNGEAAVWTGAFAFAYPHLPIVLIGEDQFKFGRPQPPADV